MCLGVGLAEAVVADVGVPLGGGDVRVPQQLLHGTQIRAAIQQVCGEGMPQRVRVRGPRRNGDLLRAIPAAERTGGEKVAVAVDFINGRFGSGAITWGVNIPHPGFFERG